MSHHASSALTAIELAWTLPDDYTPTADEQRTLEAFTGWGALAKAFDPQPQGSWVEIADRLEAVLPKEAFRSAASQVDTSFFTPREITDAVWRILADAGFTGGTVFEPGCGAGAFLRSAPVPIEATGVEIDPTSARIARMLTPGTEIVRGALEETPVRASYYDVAIGNVPFSDVRVSDAEGRYDNLHNYFIRRAAESVRPGGYVALITSRHTMDALNGLESLLTAGEAAFIGAVRLPAGAFRDSGTDAVTDIIVLRKNDERTFLPAYPYESNTVMEEYGLSYYGKTRRVDARGLIGEVPVSRYWFQRPAHVAGVMEETGFNRAPLTVRSDDARSDIARALEALSGDLVPMAEAEATNSIDDIVLEDADGRAEGSFHVIDGTMHRVIDGALTAVRGSKELEALVELRDLAADLLALESDVSLPDEAITPTRERAHTAYAAYVARFGALNRGTLTMGKEDPETGVPAYSWRRPAMGGFRKDPGSALVMALEVFDQDTGSAHAAPILTRRVNRAPERATRAQTPAEALSISLGETGRVDLDRIACLLDLPDATSARDALGELVFMVEGVPTAAAEALSGDVRDKLERARRFDGPEAERYISALEKVVPEDLTATDVHMTLGSPFVSTADIETFLKDVLGVRWPRVTHTPEQSYWEITSSGTGHAEAIEWGVPGMEPDKLVEHALNNKMPEIRDSVWRDGRSVSVKNMQATAAAAQKLALIQDRFSTWVWEDDERAGRILTDYNERMNSHVTRVYDGSHLTFPGLSDQVTPWAHQLSAVERIASSERALIAHAVGSGKTLTMALAAMTLRRFGHAQKPMIVVPNHLLDQIAREAQQAFPAGRFLIATKDELARDQRRLFAARCATGDWDAVIITHSAFGQIPVTPEVEQNWLSEGELRMRQAMAHSPQGSRGAKALARAARALNAQMSKLRAGKNDPDTIFFEQLGVDYLMVDEAHLYRRLNTGSKSRDNGMGSGSSKRATDLLLKIDTLAARKGAGAPVVSMFTGTPWSNTLAETWVWQRYLQPRTLRRAQVEEFDAWVAAFIRFESSIEVAPDGAGFRMHRRPVGVVNVPELKTMLNQVADVLDPAELASERPDVTVQNITVEPTEDQRRFVADLAERAEKIHQGEGGDDNMLVICNDGRKVALDPQLVGLDDQSTKITEAARMIADAHHDNADRTFGNHTTPGGFQLVFMDLGTPGSAGSQTYGRLRAELVAHGVPAAQIRFVHEATTDKARAALFASCRDGGVSVLIASTAKAGMGTNVQSRLTHLWHIDAPWLPSDVIQREGRGVRPGNLAGHVTITRLVTEGTFDAYMWQALERKSRAFDALYADGQTAREIEDVSQATMSYGEVKALASGNPLLLEQAAARAEVKQLQMQRSMHRAQVSRILRTAEDERRHQAHLQGVVHNLEEALQMRESEQEGEREAIAPKLAESLADAEERGTTYVRTPFRGLTLIGHKSREEGVLRVDLRAGYRTVGEVHIAPKLRRRGLEAVVGYVLDRTSAMLDELEGRIADLSRKATEAGERSVQAASAAESAVFDGEDDLLLAVERLAMIDASIADQTTAREPVAA